eukprot:4603471-Pleurochrysis_carterae.AAC.3
MKRILRIGRLQRGENFKRARRKKDAIHHLPHISDNAVVVLASDSEFAKNGQDFVKVLSYAASLRKDGTRAGRAIDDKSLI